MQCLTVILCFLSSLCFERSIIMVLNGVTAIWFLGMSVQDQEKGVCAREKKSTLFSVQGLCSGWLVTNHIQTLGGRSTSREGGGGKERKRESSCSSARHTKFLSIIWISALSWFKLTCYNRVWPEVNTSL